MSHAEITNNNAISQNGIPHEFTFADEHPQLKISFSAFVDNRKLEGTSISLTKAEVTGLLPSSIADSEELVALRFDFDGFSINLYADVKIRLSPDSNNPKISLIFAKPTGDHLPALRYILNSFIAGEIVSMGALLGFTGPTTVKTAKAKASTGAFAFIKTTLRTTVLAGLGVALVLAAGSTLYQRMAYSYEANPVAVSRDGDVMRATASGQITYINFEATSGEVAYSINSNTGDLLSTKMPCDCMVLPFQGFYEGATVLAGDAIMKLTHEDASLVSDFKLSNEGATLLIEGAYPELELASGEIIPVSIDFIDDSSTGENLGFVSAKVTLPQSASVELEPGDFARLRFQNPGIRDVSQELSPLYDTMIDRVGGAFEFLMEKIDA